MTITSAAVDWLQLRGEGEALVMMTGWNISCAICLATADHKQAARTGLPACDNS